MSYGYPQTGMLPILSGLWPLTIAPCCHHRRCQCYCLVAGCKALCCGGVPCHNHKILKGSPFSCSVSFQGPRSLGFSPMLPGWLPFFWLQNFSAAAQKSYCSYTRGHCIVLGILGSSFSSEPLPWERICFLFTEIPKYF